MKKLEIKSTFLLLIPMPLSKAYVFYQEKRTESYIPPLLFVGSLNDKYSLNLIPHSALTGSNALTIQRKFLLLNM